MVPAPQTPSISFRVRARRTLMPALINPRHERAAQARARGKTQPKAYEEAGYKPHKQNASRLMTNDDFGRRVAEIQREEHERLFLERKSLINAVLRNAETAMGMRPATIGKEGEERKVYIYRGDVANNAIKLAGLECGMFTERKEVSIHNDFDKYSDLELVQLLAQEAQMLLLSDRSGGGEDGNGDPDLG